MAYRDGPREVVLRTRCGAERHMTIHAPMKIIEVPMHEPRPENYMDDINLVSSKALSVRVRYFEFKGRRTPEDLWVYEEVPEVPSVRETRDAHEVRPPIAKVSDLVLRDATANTMKHLAEACLPFKIQEVKTERNMLRDEMSIFISAVMTGKAWAAARCGSISTGYQRALDALKFAEAENNKLVEHRNELKDRNESLTKDLHILSQQLGNDAGRDKLARENEELRRDNARLEYALAQKTKERQALSSRYKAECVKTQAVVDALAGVGGSVYLDEDRRMYKPGSQPHDIPVYHVGTGDLGSLDRLRVRVRSILETNEVLCCDDPTDRSVLATRIAAALAEPRPGAEEPAEERRYEMAPSAAGPERLGPDNRPETALGSVPERQGPVPRISGIRLREVALDTTMWDD